MCGTKDTTSQKLLLTHQKRGKREEKVFNETNTALSKTREFGKNSL